MKTKIHKILWEARWNKTKKDIYIEVTDTDCMVTAVSNPIAKWALEDYWDTVCKWFQKQGAQITLGEEIPERNVADEFPRHEKNPRRLPDAEWMSRLIYTKS